MKGKLDTVHLWKHQIYWILWYFSCTISYFSMQLDSSLSPLARASWYLSSLFCSRASAKFCRILFTSRNNVPDFSFHLKQDLYSDKKTYYGLISLLRVVLSFDVVKWREARASFEYLWLIFLVRLFRSVYIEFCHRYLKIFRHSVIFILKINKNCVSYTFSFKKYLQNSSFFLRSFQLSLQSFSFIFRPFA